MTEAMKEARQYLKDKFRFFYAKDVSFTLAGGKQINLAGISDTNAMLVAGQLREPSHERA